MADDETFSGVIALVDAARPIRRQAEYRVSITLEVSDLDALWRAAARVIAGSGACMSEVFDTIGPRDDPSVADCIATLASPVPIPGVELDDFWIDQVAAPARADVDQPQAAQPATNPQVAPTDRRLRLPLMPRNAASFLNLA